jgi:hypothetical protein
MDNKNKNTSGPDNWNDQNQIVNEQEQNRPVNTGDQDYQENTTGRTSEPSPRDLNVSGSDERNTSKDSEGGAEVETPHKKESDDETSTERKIPKM